MREFLKGLELDANIVDQIMAEYGKKFNESNDDKDVINALKKQVKELGKEIEGYKATIEDNKKSLESLEALTNENKDLKADIQLTGTNVKKEFSKFVRNEVLSMVDDNTDFTKALEDYKKENPQYFGDVQITKVQTSPNLNVGGGQPKTTNNIMNEVIRGIKNN